MAAEYDPTDASDKNVVRLLISDVGGENGSSFLFQDEEINIFLELGGSVMLAAAQGLRTIAGNAAMVAKRIKFLELETDGPAEAKALRELAESLEKRADEAEEDGDEDWDPIVEMITEPFGDRQRRLGW